MNKIIITLLLIIIFLGNIQASESKFEIRIGKIDTIGHQVLDSILNLNLSSFINKPVDSLIIKLPLTANAKKIMAGGRVYFARRLSVNYGDKYIVYLIVDNFQHMNSFDANRQWDMNLFKQELISWILVYNKEMCIYGCNTRNSWD